jgi:glyoxylase-like metal-dependent hydrolase (beta-lactamase superfamily II)
MPLWARGRALINCNAAIFENDKDLLIVDAHSAPSAVSALVAQIRRQITQKPVRYVVTTHVHGDHTQGLAGYRQISPSVDMIGGANTRRVLAQSGAARLKSAVGGTARSIENLSQRLAQAKSVEEKAWCQEMISQTRAFQEEMRNVPLEFPNVTFKPLSTVGIKDEIR